MPSLLDSLSADLVPPTPSAAVPPTNLLAAPAVSPVRRDPPGRRIDDVASTRQAIYGSVLDAFRSLPPATNSRYTLRLDNLDYEDPEDVPLAKQKAAILQGDTVTRRLRGDWVLADVAGNEVDRRRSTVAAVPHLTERGTYIVNGVEYTLANQLRLRPGIYARQKANGEAELHVNTMPGKGVTHRYFLDPESGIFRAQFGQARLPALPILEALGATDEELTKAWGADLLAVNRQKADAKGLDAVYSKLIPRGDPRADHVTKRKAIADFFKKMEFDPAVTLRTLGMAVKGMDAATAVAATKKLLAVTRGEADSDDRDHMANQLFFGPEDLFSERARRAGTAVNPLLWAATYDGSLRRVPPNALTKHVQAALLDSGLGNPLEEVNAADVFDQLNRVTRLGVGSIASLDAVPADSRMVQPSHFNFIDPIITPESLKAGVDGRVTAEVRKGSDGLLYSRFLDKTGQPVWLSAEEASNKPVALPGELDGDARHVAAVVNGRVDMVDRNDVEYAIPDFDSNFSPIANLLPFRSGSKAHRTAMGSRFITQALPLVDAESPLVRSADQTGQPYDTKYGDRFGAVRAEADGRVESVSPEAIVVRYADGRRQTHQLYNMQPYNRKSVVGDTEIVILRGTEIHECRIADYVFTSGDLTLSVDPETKKSAWLPVLGYTCHDNDKRLLRIRTRSGREVTVTEDHSLMTMGEDGSLRPIFPRDCKVARTRLPVALLPVPESAASGEDAAACDRGFLAGLYLAEGHCVPGTGRVVIAVKPEERAEEVAALLRRQGLKPSVGRSHAVRFHDKATHTWLCQTFGHLAHNKRIPDSVLTASRAYRLALLNGYMAGDGCLWSDRNGAIQLTAYTVSRQLRDDLVSLLSTLGVFAVLSDKKPTGNPNWRDVYGFRVVSAHIERLPRWFFYQDREEKLRARLSGNYRSSNYELVPVPAAARPQLYAEFPAGAPPYVQKTARQGAVAKHRLTDCVGVFGSWGRSDVMWDPIESITPVSHQPVVYDISVDRAEAFSVCRGLIVHNTFLHNSATVQPGDPVTAGQLIARSNFTDGTGTLALGRNLRTAYMPYKGAAYEDAVVVSESAAKKLTSQHMYQHEAEFTPDTRRGKAAYLGIFPAKYDRRMTDVIDDDGAVKPGTVVQPGDPLVLAASPRALSHKQVHSAHKGTFRDDSLTWDHHEPGTVVDVARTSKGVVVTVETHKPLVQADKLCFDPETKILTRSGWKFVPDVRLGEEVFTLNPDTGFCEWQPVSHVWEYSHTGQMVQIVTKQIDMLVTPDHKVWAAKGYTGPDSDYRGVKASELIEGGVWRFRKDGAWAGQEKVDYVFPSDSSKRRDKRTVILASVKADDWAEFLGYYLAEGWCQKGGSQNGGYVKIGQFRESPHWSKIDALLMRMGLKYRYDEKAGRFEIGNSWFYRQLVGLGDSYTKRVPEWVQELCPRQLRIFFDAYMNGDGHRGAAWEFSSSSEGLMYDLQLICVKLGWATHVVESTRTDNWSKARHWRSRLNRRQLRPSIKPSEAGTDGRLQGYVPYDGKVYCVTVPNHTLYVSRNGKTYWSQNSGRMGDKGVCSRIVPDAEMPHDEQGRPFELILNPLSVISRANTGQVFEALLGKIAAATGKPYDVTDMGGTRDWTEYVQQELDKHGMSSTETVVDPTTGRRIPGVLTGVRYALKLMHTAASKDQGRGLGAYTADDTPAKTGGPEGCFAGEQAVETVYGPMRISSICEQQLSVPVRTFDETTGEWVYRPVTNWFIRRANVADMVTVKVTNERGHVDCFHATTDHEILMFDGTRKPAGELRTGDTLVTWQPESATGAVASASFCKLGKAPLMVSDVTPYTPPKAGVTDLPVYDITVDQTHTYVAGGALVSNSSKRVAMMDVHSLLSSGATEVLRDAKLIRGQKNQEYWADFMAGNRPATPNVPLVYRKFIDQLRGSGINVVRTGNKTHLYALTDADTEELAGDREIRSADTVDWANGMKPIPGGLFDPTLTGGHGNSGRWSFMKLVEPMPSPVMEEPIRRLLGLTKPKFEAVLAGRDRLGTGTGPTAIHAALKSIDVDAAIAKARDDVKSGRASLRDAAVRRLGYLTAAQRAGVRPSDWMWTKLPIIPPAFRPVSVMQQTNSPLVADANFLYKEAFDANGALRDLREKVADVGDERLALYSALKAVTGLGDPIQPKNQEKHVRGLLRHVFGWNPKQGVVQQKLLGTSTDMVGRAVVVPNPDLSMDEVGLPEERAWAVYTPFVVRRLVKDGVSRLDALRFAKDRTPIAKRALLAEMGSRPVIVTRAPVLHRYGELAFMPKLVKGDALRVPPVVVGGFGMDFDGDQQIGAVYVAIPNNIDGAFARTMIPGPNPILTLENYRMPFSASLGIPALPADHTLCVFNLEDFPHGAFSHTSKGQFGHIDWYHVQDGVQVLAHDHETGHMKWTAVSMWSKHHGCPVELVELQSGRQLVTDDDPRAVYGVAAGSVALTRTTPTDALAKKFLVPRVVRLTVDDAVAAKELSTAVLVGDRSHVKRNRLKPAIAADHSFGYLVGVLAGDGWVITDKKTARAKDVCLAGITDEVIAKTHASISQLYVDDAPKACSVVSSASYGESRRTTWTSTELAEFLAPMIGHGAVNKHLPPWFLSVSKECREGLFAGLMDTDGSISVSNAKGKPQLMSNFASNSLRLVQEVQLLAMSLDIKGRITASKTPGGNDHWTLSFSNLDIARWGGKGMVHPEKLAKLVSVTPDATSNIAARNDLVPIPFELVKPLRLAVYKGKTKTGPWESPQQCSTYLALAKAATTGYVTRQTAKFALAFRPDFDHPALPAWRAIVDNDRVTWDPVVAVEKTGRVETGYDLTVPGYETFMAADGVVLSNTSNYHVPASDEARDEALAKMLPSRNLFSVKTFKADVFGPRQEYSAGLYAASTRKADRRPRVFRTARDAARAYYNGEIDADHPIEILEHS